MLGEKILLAHGSGGKLSHDLVERLFLKYFDNPILANLDDAAVVQVGNLHTCKLANFHLAFTTDSYVVNPIFFPGGDIGKLAVCGTVNDLAMRGAQPVYFSAAFILEEGLPLADLERIVASMAETAEEAGVEIVTGDTKVVNRGGADKVFITTSGVGVVPAGLHISGSNARPGDAVILSGPIGDHGMAIMMRREGLRFKSTLVSDCAPLHGLVAEMLAASSQIHCLRDPTRGGLASALNELATQSRVGIKIEEGKVPVREEVRACCEMLGLDPLYVANEGKLVAVVAPEDVARVLEAMRRNPYSRDAAIIGRVRAEHPGRVVMHTLFGASRIVDMLVGEQLPRIC